MHDFYEIYARNHEIFQRDAFRVQSTNSDVTNLEQLFNHFNQTVKMENHNLWRCNRILPARLLRQLIGRPSVLPSSVALERFMTIDTPQAPSYTLPDTECPHVYIQQAMGTRFIILRPTSECRQRCRTLSMRLPQSFVCKYCLEIFLFNLYVLTLIFFCFSPCSKLQFLVLETHICTRSNSRQYVTERNWIVLLDISF